MVPVVYSVYVHCSLLYLRISGVQAQYGQHDTEGKGCIFKARANARCVCKTSSYMSISSSIHQIKATPLFTIC